MKFLKILFAFLFCLLTIYCVMIESTSDDPTLIILFIFGIAFFAIYLLIKALKEFYNDSTIQI